MSTVFTGFNINRGSFPNKSTGDLVEYSNYILKFSTNDGADQIVSFGYSSYEVDKVKRSVLSSWFKLADDDASVDKFLTSCIGKLCTTVYAPVSGELQFKGFTLTDQYFKGFTP